MVKLNLSEGKDYYSQRNNLLDPHASCAPTSMIMALTYSGYILPDCGKRQPEDVFMEYLRTDRLVQKWYAAAFPQQFALGIPANEFPPAREYGLNAWMGRAVNRFSWGATIQEIVYSLIKKKAVVVSGEFPYVTADGRKKGISHVVCVVGFESAQDNVLRVPNATIIQPDLLSTMIIDDPYGDYRNGYKEKRGNDIPVPMKDFIRMTKELDSRNKKWAHFVL